MGSRVVIVTGGGSGLGRAMALALLAAGHRVVVAGRRADVLDETLIMGHADDRGLAVPCDVTDADAVNALVGAAVERFGRLDVMINNAGASVGGSGRRGDPRRVAPSCGDQSHRHLLVRGGRDAGHARAGPPGRADHQQRVEET